MDEVEEKGQVEVNCKALIVCVAHRVLIL